MALQSHGNETMILPDTKLLNCNDSLDLNKNNITFNDSVTTDDIRNENIFHARFGIIQIIFGPIILLLSIIIIAIDNSNTPGLHGNGMLGIAGCFAAVCILTHGIMLLVLANGYTGISTRIRNVTQCVTIGLVLLAIIIYAVAFGRIKLDLKSCNDERHKLLLEKHSNHVVHECKEPNRLGILSMELSIVLLLFAFTFAVAQTVMTICREKKKNRLIF